MVIIKIRLFKNGKESSGGNKFYICSQIIFQSKYNHDLMLCLKVDDDCRWYYFMMRRLYLLFSWKSPNEFSRWNKIFRRENTVHSSSLFTFHLHKWIKKRGIAFFRPKNIKYNFFLNHISFHRKMIQWKWM